MPRSPQSIPAKSEVLRWAREASGYTRRQAAQRLGLAQAELAAIESGEQAPTPAVFQRMTALYHRVESVLLLPHPPDPDPLPEDYRTGARAAAPLSPETLLAIREARRIQHYVSELVDADPELITHANIPRATVSDDPEALASEERARFRVTMAMQRQWRPGREAFEGWRARTQAVGILVLVKKMPWEDCRGLSLWHQELVPMIVVNSDDALNARIFTLFHEYAHLMLRQSGVCIQAQSPTPKGRIELWTNSFAAEFLVPSRDLRRSVEARFSDLEPPDWTIDDIRKLATEFRVSRHVIARRLSELKISDFYARHADELRLFDKQPTRETGGVPRPAGWQVTQKLAEVGFATAGVVLEALNEQIIDATEAADMLQLGVDQLPEFEERAALQRSRDPVA